MHFGWVLAAQRSLFYAFWLGFGCTEILILCILAGFWLHRDPYFMLCIHEATIYLMSQWPGSVKGLLQSLLCRSMRRAWQCVKKGACARSSMMSLKTKLLRNEEISTNSAMENCFCCSNSSSSSSTLHVYGEEHVTKGRGM